MTLGRVNPNFRLEDQGIEGLGNVYYNYLEPALIESALARNEGLGNVYYNYLEPAVIEFSSCPRRA